MNLSVTNLGDTAAFNYGEIATIKSQVGLCETSHAQMRSLLADHHMKRLAQ